MMNIVGLALIALAVQAADTTPPPGATESPYTINSAGLQLGGTLTLPRGATGPVPLAVIIAGSGPTDRNGNSMLGIRPNAYAQLAWRLAERGIATLRYDKRGMPGTKGTFDITKMTLAGQMGTYNDPTVAIAPAVVSAIADWINALAAMPPSDRRSPGH